MQKNSRINTQALKSRSKAIKDRSSVGLRLRQAERLQQSESEAVDDDDESGDVNEDHGFEDADNGDFRFSQWTAHNIGTENSFFQAVIGGLAISVVPQENEINIHIGDTIHTYKIRENNRQSLNSNKDLNYSFDVPLVELFGKAVAMAQLALKEQEQQFYRDAERLTATLVS